MPMGMIGLLVSGIFAATMSSMDSGLNKNAGIFVRNFYRPVLRKTSSETELLFVGKITTVVFGIFVILAALYIEQIKNFGLFDVMQLFSAFINIPYAIPLILMLIIKHSPRWSAWSTILIGFMVSYFVNYVLDPEIVRNLIGMDTPFTAREGKDYLFFTSMILNVFICSGWFISTSLIFGKKNKADVLASENKFYHTMTTPVIANPKKSIEKDKNQLRTLGNLCLAYGGFIMLLFLIPNNFAGRMSFIFCGGVISLIGLLLYKKSKKMQPAN
jgi:Na+/proline symporter